MPTKHQQSPKAVYEAIIQTIQSKGHEPTPTAFYACLLNLLQGKPDSNILPHVLRFLCITIHKLDVGTGPGVLLKTKDALLQALVNVVQNFKSHAQRAYPCIRALFLHIQPTQKLAEKIRNLRPSCHDIALSKGYISTIALMLHQLPTNAPPCVDVADIFREFLKLYFASDSAQALTQAATTELKRAISVLFVGGELPHQDGSPLVGKTLLQILSHALTTNVTCTHFVLDLLATGVKRLGQVYKDEEFFTQLVIRIDKIRQSHRKEEPADNHIRQSADKVLAEALRAMRSEQFFRLLDFDPLDDKSPRQYLLRVTEKYLSHDNISFFMEHFQPKVKHCYEKASEAARIKADAVKASWEWRAEQLFALLPSYCTYPMDLAADKLYPKLARWLCEDMMKRSHRTKAICSTCFRLLITKNLKLVQAVPKDDAEMATDRDDDINAMDTASTVGGGTSAPTFLSFHSAPSATTVGGNHLAEKGQHADGDEEDVALEENDIHSFHGISREEAQKNIDILVGMAGKILPSLCNTFEHADLERRSFLLETIREYAKIAPEAVSSKLFQTVEDTLKKLVQGDGDAGKDTSKMIVMCDVASTMVEVLNDEQIKSLSGIIPELLADSSAAKRAYKLLEKISYFRHDEPTASVFASLLLKYSSCPANCLHHRVKCWRNIYKTFMAKYSELKLNDDAAASDASQRLTKVTIQVMPEFLVAINSSNAKVRTAAHHTLVEIAKAHRAMHGDNITDFIWALKELQDRDETPIKCGAIVSLGHLLHEFSDELSAEGLGKLVLEIAAHLRAEEPDIRNAGQRFAKLILKRSAVSENTLGVLRVPEVAESLVRGILHGFSSPHCGRFKLRALVEKCVKRFGVDEVLKFTNESNRRIVEYVEKERRKAERKKKKPAKGDEEGPAAQDADKGRGARAAKRLQKAELAAAEQGNEEDDDGYRLSFDANNTLLIESTETKDEAAEEFNDPEGQAHLAKKGSTVDTYSLKLDNNRGRKRQREDDLEKSINKGEQYRGKGRGDIMRGSVDPHAYVPFSKRFLDKRFKRVASRRFEGLIGTPARGRTPTRAKSAQRSTSRAGSQTRQSRPESRARKSSKGRAPTRSQSKASGRALKKQKRK